MQWGTTTFMVNREVYDGDIDTLAMIFDPPEPLQGEVNMLRDVNDVLNMGLRYLGHPRCNDNEEQLRELNELMQNSEAVLEELQLRWRQGGWSRATSRPA